MAANVERIDRRRQRLLAASLVSSVVFLILLVLRFFFRQGGLNDQPVGTVVLAGLGGSLLALALCTAASWRLGNAARDDPQLREALDDELVRTLEAQSWKAAYLGAVGATAFFAVAGFFYPVCDAVMTALTATIAGAACYQGSLYFRYRAL